ncbi:MAG: sugar phosphate isomerase/epimerase [Bryobacterales bacterium]|nr:sugar phosphate isomerase/epimerase [Bryobacterales bacterium]
MSFKFRHAICNEAYQGWDFAEACRSMKTIGYEGIEIAPFTLADNPATIPAADRSRYARIIREEGLTFAGLHWLMVAPKGLHVTTADDALRQRSWTHIRNLVDLCADLGPRGVMVFGSPHQRGTTGGSTREEANRRFVDGLAEVAPHALERGVRILVEALPANQTDVVLSLAEAAGIVNQINSPAVRTMFDTHNAVDETEPHAQLIAKYFPLIEHVHVNEIDGGHCGTGDYDFKPVLEVLKRLSYRGWVSLEAFKFDPGSETIARDSLQYLQSRIEELN